MSTWSEGATGPLYKGILTRPSRVCTELGAQSQVKVSRVEAGGGGGHCRPPQTHRSAHSYSCVAQAGICGKNTLALQATKMHGGADRSSTSTDRPTRSEKPDESSQWRNATETCAPQAHSVLFNVPPFNANFAVRDVQQHAAPPIEGAKGRVESRQVWRQAAGSDAWTEHVVQLIMPSGATIYCTYSTAVRRKSPSDLIHGASPVTVTAGAWHVA